MNHTSILVEKLSSEDKVIIVLNEKSIIRHYKSSFRKKYIACYNIRWRLGLCQGGCIKCFNNFNMLFVWKLTAPS